MQKLRQLSMEFTNTATQVGEVIIAEKFLPNDAKTIKSMTTQVGGYAGGEKYIVDGIFYKFAVDNKGKSANAGNSSFPRPVWW